jgi:K+-sensing histidine kinase KdpD
LLHWVGQPRSTIRALGILAAAIVLATGVRYLIGLFAPDTVPFAFYFAAVLAAAATGGFWSGLLATAISVFVAA